MSEAKRILRVMEYVSAATMKAMDCRFLGTEPAGSRVVFLFGDEDGMASKILAQHQNGGCEINSARLSAELAFIRTQMFASKDRPQFETRGGGYRNGASHGYQFR